MHMDCLLGQKKMVVVEGVAIDGGLTLVLKFINNSKLR